MSAELQLATQLDESFDAGAAGDASFLFAGQEDDDAPPPNKLDALRDRLAPRTANAEAAPHPVLDLLGELATVGGDHSVARFFEAHGITEDDLAIAKGKKADEYVRLLRAAVAEAEKAGAA